MASAVRPSHNRLHDRRDASFVLYELENVAFDETHLGILEACENFVEDWSHADATMDRNPPQLVPAANSGERNAVRSHEVTHLVVEAAKERGVSQMSELGLPFSVECAAMSILASGFSSNIFGLFTLTRCAADLLDTHGSAALKEKYLHKMRSGEWFGTMALSEPHAGSSLAAIRSMATPVTNGESSGEYRIKGDKMWTTGAFHDLSDNIVHMLLARTPGAMPGAAGISLFLVPNVLADGTPNDVELVSLNKKMGHRAITNCAWTLGEREGGAVGYLVGREGSGLVCMLQMMKCVPRQAYSRLVPCISARCDRLRRSRIALTRCTHMLRSHAAPTCCAHMLRSHAARSAHVLLAPWRVVQRNAHRGRTGRGVPRQARIPRGSPIRAGARAGGLPHRRA